VGVGEVGALSHEDDVGQRHQAAPEPDRRSVHRGDHGDAAGHHARDDLPPVEEALLAQGVVADELVDVVEVAARREGAAVAGEDGDPCVEVGVQLREETGQRAVELMVGGVELVGSVQADDPHRAVGLDGDDVGEVVGMAVAAHWLGSSRIRLAMRLRWICAVPPMTLWARL
jgi:hypothetical protein